MATPTTRRLGAAALAAGLLAAGLLAAAPIGAAHAADDRHRAGATPVTRAGLDPALLDGRGAAAGFAEQRAADAATDGTVLATDTTPYTLAAEATGRSAVTLAPGQYVEFTLPAATNAITVRYSIPDAPGGGGRTAPLDVTVNGHHRQSMTLTSQYAWLYNEYPFTNDPAAGPLHPDWWTTECDCVPNQTTPAPAFPTPFRASHFYDEQRLLLDHTYRAGDVLRLQVPTGAGAVATTVDVLDSQQVDRPERAAPGSLNVLDFGADPTGRRESSDAFDAAIAVAQRTGRPVYVPPGTFQVNRHLLVDRVTIRGAGSWYTVIKGHQVTLAQPDAGGGVHTGVGFYGKPAADGGSHDVHLSGFAVEGDVRERIDTDQVNGVGGAFDDSSIEGLYIHHTKVGIWLDGPMSGLRITGNQIADQIADGINFHGGVTDSTISQNFVRNTGDDGIALWSQPAADQRDLIDHNTVQTPVLANGIALYGGTDLTVNGNLVADPVREGSAIHLGTRFDAVPFAGTVKVSDNTTVRAGTYELNWKIGLGAIWLMAQQHSLDADVEVTGDHFLDSTYAAIMMVADWPVKDQYTISNVHFKGIRVDGTGTDVVSARAAGGASFQNVAARNVGAVGVNNCGSFHFTPAGSEFSLTDLGGNTGGGTTGAWLAPWELPNTITCADRPAVVPPPAPGPWR
ncbi:mycodextranase [Streptomyces tateyamensis]|uniref:Mycodextranase n=1 Tax=Streptomyces tateyamensis TaxID=565073 RepID=A0A2V4NG92_9ACTN|nr:glycosyl hydrolase family 28-related protein [Streptomyces tateyamensis]PYC78257.1 mycodextranase [Streptomyces tateyamensis]